MDHAFRNAPRVLSPGRRPRGLPGPGRPGLSPCWLARRPAPPPPPFDSADYLRRQIEPGTGLEAGAIELPFELAPDLEAEANRQLKPSGDERNGPPRWSNTSSTGSASNTPSRRPATPTEPFAATPATASSFVNLFVALARHLRLSPFYVEVEDYQRWDHRQGMVISQGHIVAGLYIGGDLKTYDFMPYRVKSYRDFQPIDDLTATAHYYNNLGAEALLDGRDEDADHYLGIAGRIDPKFVKGANNLGVLYARRGDYAKAIATYQAALEIEPQNVPLLTNLARAYQQTGRAKEADEILASVEGVHHTNPFFYVYRADLALSRGDHVRALDFLRQALAIDSETPEVHLGLTRVYVALGDLDKAKHYLQRALKLDPTQPEARKLAALFLPAFQAPATAPNRPSRAASADAGGGAGARAGPSADARWRRPRRRAGASAEPPRPPQPGPRSTTATCGSATSWPTTARLRRAAADQLIARGDRAPALRGGRRAFLHRPALPRRSLRGARDAERRAAGPLLLGLGGASPAGSKQVAPAPGYAHWKATLFAHLDPAYRMLLDPGGAAAACGSRRW